METNVDRSSHSGWTHCNWLQHVFVLIRAEGIDPGTGSDLSGDGSATRGRWIPITSPVINRALFQENKRPSLLIPQSQSNSACW